MEPTLPSIEYLFDIFYADRPRLLNYLAQIDPNGTLTSIKVTGSDSQTTSTGLSIGPNALKGNQAGSSHSSNGFERVFDPALVLPLTVMNTLDEKGFIGRDLTKAHLGSLVLCSGALRIKDMTQSAALWPIMEPFIPFEQMAADNRAQHQKGTGPKPPSASTLRQACAAIFKSMQHPVQADIRSDNGNIWMTLGQDGLCVPLADIGLKYDRGISGTWHALCLLDTKPENDDFYGDDDSSDPSMTDVLDNVSRAFMRLFGRPGTFYGVTPLLVFRKTSIPTP